MAITVIYAPINSIRLLPKVTPNPLYKSQPVDLWNKDCYFQKYMIADTAPMQILSDIATAAGLVIELYDIYSDTLVHTYTAVDTTYTTPYDTLTLKIFEVDIPFASIPEGKYYLQLSYDDGTQIQILQGGIEVAQDWENTLLFEYRNSTNKFSAIFDTGIIFKLRVEGTIWDYTAEFEDDVYNDEIHNTTKLDSVYFDRFKLYVPGIEGYIPSWMFKRVNVAMSCDSVSIDGEFYGRIEGSKWDVQRAPIDIDMMGVSIDIEPSENLYNKRLTAIEAGGDNNGNFQNVRRSIPAIKLQSVDFQIAGVFKANVTLDYFTIYNLNNTAFNLKIGTTAAGQELGYFEIKADEETGVVADNFDIELKVPFNSSETVYLSGLTGVAGLSLNIFCVYDQMDAPLIQLPFTVEDNVGIGSVCRFEEINIGDLIAAFDLGTGLGVSGSLWEKWAIKDGRNGGADESGCVAVMYDPTNPDYAADKLKTTGGADKITLTTAQLPNFYLKMFGDDVNVGGGDIPNNAQRVSRSRNAASPYLNYEMSRSGNVNDDGMVGRTSSIGEGAQIDNRQKYLVSLWVIKIAA